MHTHSGFNADVSTGQHLYRLHFPEANLPIVRYQSTRDLAAEASAQYNCAYLASSSDTNQAWFLVLSFASRADDILFV